MSEQTARRLAWSIAGVSTVLVLAGLIMSSLAILVSGFQVGPFVHQFFIPVFVVSFCVVGGLVASRHPRNPIGWIFCAVGLLSALNMLTAGYDLYNHLVLPGTPLPAIQLAHWLNSWLWMLNILLPVTFLLLLFPDGHLPSSRWRPIAWAAGLGSTVYLISVALHPGPLPHLGIDEANRLGIPGAEGLLDILLAISGAALFLGIFGSIAAVIVRFRRSQGIERAQLKWLAYAGLVIVIGGVFSSILWMFWPDSPLAEQLSIIITNASVAAIVIAAGFAMLRYHLWDIDIVINRTLVYTLLTASIVGIYVIIVGALGAGFQTGGSLPVSLFATGIVAMSFQPLRERLQRGVNRLMYGERDEPYAVLGRLSERLEVVVASQSVLPTIVETVAEALKLPYAAIALRDGQSFAIAAEYTRDTTHAPPGAPEVLPLVYQMETIGQLLLAPRAQGEPFSQADRQLLETIARQAGIAAYNVRLTQDLQRSRERLVTTREEERRRLRRDLHDGLGPALASMSFKLDAVSNWIESDPQTARRSVIELKSQIQTALNDIRRIAYNLRPPALDELGLVGALNEHIADHNQSHTLHIVLEADGDMSNLAAAVEVAAYRIVTEAITNVARHARAPHCVVKLTMDDALCLEVGDDGQGLPSSVRAGVGLTSMRERAEELGGTCMVSSQPGQGTQILVRLPC